MPVPFRAWFALFSAALQELQMGAQIGLGRKDLSGQTLRGRPAIPLAEF